jgi:hypothetical protein
MGEGLTMKKTIREDFRVIATPQALGYAGSFTIPDEKMSSDPAADYLERCHEITRMLRAHQHVASAVVRFDTRDVCSHCEEPWEPMTAEQAANSDYWLDEHSVEGEPACCGEAIEEFRTERGVPLPEVKT